jgi:UDP-N-acetylmuramoyl-tripeptide--D-alanyl-D-alanine ligase
MEIEKLYQYFLKSTGIATDTRKIDKGKLFFALKGENFNGNTFAEQAKELGAILSVIDEPKYENENTFLVEDTLKALQDLANYHRQKVNIKVLGITGSNGKTTCKELVSRVLSKKFKVSATFGNLNNHIGVPLTILSWPKDTEFAVVEMGANHQHEIEQLCEIAMPNFGVITSIGKAHIEGFGGVEGVIKGKGELFDYLSAHHGLAFVNQNIEVLHEMANQRKLHTYLYGKQSDGVHGMIHSTQPFVDCDVFFDRVSYNIQSNLIGEYNFLNILSAATIGYYFGVAPQDIVVAISGYISDNNRSQFEKVGENNIIFDAYNANPTSVSHAIKYLDELDAENKIVIIGDMWELGEYAIQEHQAIVNQIKNCTFSKVILVGALFGKIELPSAFLHFNDNQEAKKWFDNSGIKNATILLKGSRGMKLEKIFK